MARARSGVGPPLCCESACQRSLVPPRTTATRRTCRSPSTPTPAWSSHSAHPRPGNRNDTIGYRDSGIAATVAGRPVMADGGYRGNPEVIMPFRKPGHGQELPGWKAGYNTDHKRIRARVGHSLSRLKCWKILRDHRRAATTLADTASGITPLEIHRHKIEPAACRCDDPPGRSWRRGPARLWNLLGHNHRHNIANTPAEAESPTDRSHDRTRRRCVGGGVPYFLITPNHLPAEL